MALTKIDHVLKVDEIVSLMNELDKHYR